MNGIDKNFAPYLLAQAVAVLFLLVSWKSTRLSRLLFALLFGWAAAINLYTALTNPAIYQEYAALAVPVYREFINGWFSHNSHLLVPLIAVGQLLIGIGMLLRGGWVRWACVGAIIFLISIAPLLVGSGFPFSLIVSWAAWLILTNDRREYLWRQPTNRARTQSRPDLTIRYASLLTSLLAAITATTSLFFSQLYRDNAFVTTVWEANDWITVGLSVMALVTIQYASRYNTLRLVWAGLLGYFVYNYTFYLFGAAFNVLFLLYVGIVALGLFSLLGLLSSLTIRGPQSTTLVSRLVAGYLLLIALLLLLVELPPIVTFLTTGVLPTLIVKTGHPTGIVYALDLSLIVPACGLGAVWLWQQKPWGVVLAAILLMKGVAYGLVLCAGTLLLASRGIATDPLLPFYATLVLGGGVGLTILVRSLTTPLLPVPHARVGQQRLTDRGTATQRT